MPMRRPKRHSSSELSSPRRPSSLPSSPLSGMISSFSKTAPAPERGHGAMWILVVTKQCVRVYPASAAVTGSRSTSAKYKADGELASGSVVAPPGHPAVAVAWSETSGLHVRPVQVDPCSNAHSFVAMHTCLAAVHGLKNVHQVCLRW